VAWFIGIYGIGFAIDKSQVRFEVGLLLFDILGFMALCKFAFNFNFNFN